MQEKVKAIIFEALEELNEEREDDNKFEINQDTILFGTDGVLDSLDLVSSIVDMEGALAAEFGRKVPLSDDRAMNAEPVPFTSIATLSAYILGVLEE